MTNLFKLANEQDGTITLEQLKLFLKELEDIVERAKPSWYNDGEYHHTSLYDGEWYLLRLIKKANGLIDN